MKKLINKSETVLDEMLSGLVKAYPNKLKRVADSDVIARKTKKEKGKVGIISGGGSGHEPAHAGFVGYGMLDCAVCGEVFTSPTPDQVYKAIVEADAGAGVFMVVKNYSGDVMNFEMAKDMADAENIKVDYVVVNDDVAVEDSTYTTGRRGIAGTIYFHKVLGAMAEQNKSIEEMKKMSEYLLKNIRSMGMAIKPCTIPAVGKENFILAEDEMEIGIGIHGEPGIRKETIKSANDIAKELLDKILSELDNSGEFALMVNGMGATPQMELLLINNYVNDYLSQKNIRIYRTYVGNYMTSLDMAGFSLSLFRLNDECKKYLDHKADTAQIKEF